MEDVVLLTVKDLATRWKCSERCIRGYVEEGVVVPCKGVPGVKFHPKHIAELEGVGLDKFSPIERRKMQQKIEDLETIVKLQSEQLRKVAMLGTESMNLLQKMI